MKASGVLNEPNARQSVSREIIIIVIGHGGGETLNISCDAE